MKRVTITDRISGEKAVVIIDKGYGVYGCKLLTKWANFIDITVTSDNGCRVKLREDKLK